ncbi:MAG TPA: PAS domain-containing protein [Verrucomicrobiae bacterium]
MYQTDADFRILFESNPLPMWVYDLATLRFLAVNEAAILHYGYSREEFLELTIKDIRPSDEVAALMPTVGRIKGIDKAGVWHHIRKDGSSILVEITSHGLTFQGRAAELILAQDVTSEHEAELARRDSELLFQTLARISPVGIWRANLKGECSFVNQRWCEIAGMSLEAALGSGWTKALHLDDIAGVTEAWKSCLSDGSEFHAQYRFQRPDGKVTWVLGQGVAERREDGSVKGYVGTVTDITTLHHHEVQIQHLNRVYAVLSDINQVIVRERDPHKLFTLSCRIAVEKGGFKMAWIGLWAEETRKMVPVSVAGIEDGGLEWLRNLLQTEDACKITIQAALDEKVSVSNDFLNDPQLASWQSEARRLNIRSMAALPIKVSGRVIGTFNLYAEEPDFFDEHELELLGELAADIGFAIKVSRDEVEHKRAEAEVLEWRNRYEAAVHVSGQILYDWDIDAATLNYAGDTPRILGYTVDELGGDLQSWISLIHPADRACFEAELQRVTETPSAFQLEYRVRCKDGSYIKVKDMGHFLLNDQGKAYRVIGFMQDITAQKEAEERIKKQLDELKRWHEATLGREERIMELKSEVNELLLRLREEKRYECALPAKRSST